MPTVNSRSANGALNTYAEEARDRRRQRSGRRAAVATEDDLLLALQAGTNARIFEEEGGEEIGEASLLQKQREALATIKRVVQKRRAARQFLEAVQKARAAFLDADAIKAGALQGEFYTASALVLRNELRDHPKVQQALKFAWRCVLGASRAAQGTSGAAVRRQAQRQMSFTPTSRPALTKVASKSDLQNDDENATMSFSQYQLMYRKLYLVVKDQMRDIEIDPHDCEASTLQDWPRDAHGKTELTAADFRASWFELTDLSVNSLDPADYAACIEFFLRRLTRYAGSVSDLNFAKLIDVDKFRFRQDTQLLDALGKAAPRSYRGRPRAEVRAASR